MKILVPIDSRPAIPAIRFASRLAAGSRGELVLLTLVNPLPRVPHLGGRLLQGLASALNNAARASSERTREWALRLAVRHGVRVRSESLTPERKEPAAETIARAADRERADLVVVSSRDGGTSLTRRALGSFASRLVHVARRPVAIVPASYRDPARRVAKIVVAIDGSRASMEAVRFGARLAAAIPRARLLILTVSTLTADLALTGVGVVRRLGLIPELRRTDRRAARAILDSAAGQARELGARVTVRYHAPRARVFAEDAIVSQAARERADLIVLGNSGRTAAGDLILGSVARRAVSLARRPVALVRARSRR
jgi:nucleotide-binding universal stress UspA family protein